MKRIGGWLRGLVMRVIAALRWVWRQIRWVAEQIARLLGGIFGPPFARLMAALRALRDRIKAAIDWLLDVWDRVWRTGKTGERIREERVGANIAPLLATLSLAAIWYLVPLARWLGFGPLRFILWAFVIWVVALVAWLSRCRADRQGQIARLVQGLARSTGLRRFDQLLLLPLAILWYLVLREIQLLPLAFGALVSVIGLLIVDHTTRPELAIHGIPDFPEDAGGTASKDDARAPLPTGRTLRRTLSWSVVAHGRRHDHEAHVIIDAAALDAARADNPGRAFEIDEISDWVVHGSGPEVVRLAQHIHAACFAGAYSLHATVSCFAAASQSIEYSSDLETTGREDYWRYPIETLADGTGDCEDSAILLAALLRRAGFRCALLVSQDHAAVGVEVPHDTPGDYFERNGVRYYYCETTSDGWLIGDLPSGSSLDQFEFVPVPEWEEPT